MEPLAGGILASKPHPSIEVIWDKIKPPRSPADLALRWVWNQPEVSVVLSGMSSMQQVKENIKSANHSGVNTLTKQDLSLVSKLREASLKIGKVRCTNCRYCLPCPSDVVIPEIFNLYNEYCIKNEDPKIIEKYNKKILSQNRASKCVQCGQCEERCPQQIPIRNILKGIGFYFESSN
jgi:predicted aldo/keto reductase-like oxidoreductase